MAGQRIFNDSDTFHQSSSNHNTLAIPLYNVNSTYIIQIIATTTDGMNITSADTIISEDEFKNYRLTVRNGESVMTFAAVITLL